MFSMACIENALESFFICSSLYLDSKFPLVFFLVSVGEFGHISELLRGLGLDLSPFTLNKKAISILLSPKFFPFIKCMNLFSNESEIELAKLHITICKRETTQALFISDRILSF